MTHAKKLLVFGQISPETLSRMHMYIIFQTMYVFI